MRQLDAFLKNKVTQGGITTLEVVAFFTSPALGGVLTLFCALGFINNVFVGLCNCPVSA